MRDKELYTQILGIQRPWKVVKVELDREAHQVEVYLERGKHPPLQCPKCGESCSGYDSLPRRWRHLDTCQFETILIADVPRCDCKKHGVHQIRVPWSDPGSHFTALFEALVIDWLLESTISATARLLGLSWDEVDTIMQHAVVRGRSRKEQEVPTRIGVDETSFRKRHQYVTVVSDLDEGTVEYVSDNHTRQSLDGFFEAFEREQLEQIEAVSMDMWAPYIRSVRDNVPDGNSKICFDKFHVAKHLGDSVDKVRRQENRALVKQGDSRLKGSRYLWLQNPKNISLGRWYAFGALRNSALKTARAWAIKDVAMSLWNYVRRPWAEKAWRRWLSWASRSRLRPMVQVSRTIRRHLDGVLNAVVSKVTNAMAEGINSKIQQVKKRARGFRNRDRFRNAIYFYCGGLDLYPEPCYLSED
jgi:transposase